MFLYVLTGFKKSK